MITLLRRPDDPLGYAAPLVGLVLLVLSRWLSEDAKVNAAVVIAALGMTVYLAEVGLFTTEAGHYSRYFDFELRRMRAASQAGVDYDRRNRLEVVNDLNEEGVPAVARVHPASWIGSNGLDSGGDRLFPLSGITRSLEVTCNESGTWALVQSDEHGFRNPLGQYGPGVLDLAVIGDSYAYGACVPQGDETSAALRRSGRRVLNLGYGGNGPLIELATLKEYAEPFEPHTVLWFYFEGNDLQDLTLESGSSALLAYLDPEHSQGLLDRVAELDPLRREYHDREMARARVDQIDGERRRRRCVLLLCGIRRLVAGQAAAASSPPDLPLSLLGEILTEARDRVAAWEGEFFVVYLPSWRRYSDDFADPGGEDPSGRQEVLGLLRDAGIEVIDFASFLEDHPDPLSLFPFRTRGHFTPEGYALLAEQIERRLEAR